MGSTSKQKLQKRVPSISFSPTPSSPGNVTDVARKSILQHQQQQQQTDPASHTRDASCSCSETDARQDDGSGDDSEICDLALDGAVEDEILKGADALTEEEVIRRRSRRVKQLIKLYRMQYWGLMEELRSKYRLFYLKNGKSGWRDDAESAEKERGELQFDSIEQGIQDRVKNKGADRGMREPHAPEKASNEIVRCACQGCKTKPLALSVFCFSHILLEPRQQLYKPCTFATRSGQSGSVTCGKPVLRAMMPSYCAAHFHQAQKQTSRSLRKAGLGGASGSKPAPKLHLIIAEYVRLIQSKRWANHDAAVRHSGFAMDKEIGSAAAVNTPDQCSQPTPQV